jgi:hypothetical protein
MDRAVTSSLGVISEGSRMIAIKMDGMAVAQLVKELGGKALMSEAVCLSGSQTSCLKSEHERDGVGSEGT